MDKNEHKSINPDLLHINRLHEDLLLLTLLDAGSDSDEGHDCAQAQIGKQQYFVELARSRVCVVLEHEGKGCSGDGVEKEGGTHDCHIPLLIFSCAS